MGMQVCNDGGGVMEEWEMEADGASRGRTMESGKKETDGVSRGGVGVVGMSGEVVGADQGIAGGIRAPDHGVPSSAVNPGRGKFLTGRRMWMQTIRRRKKKVEAIDPADLLVT